MYGNIKHYMYSIKREMELADVMLCKTLKRFFTLERKTIIQQPERI
jgi:hypothetical protein